MASGKCMENLPYELLLEIFSNFTIEELAMTVQHVCSRWRDVSLDDSLWKNKSYKPDKKTKDEEIVQHLRNMPVLEEFSLVRGTSAKVMDAMNTTCQNIKKLEIHWSQRLTNSDVEKIMRGSPKLSDLTIPIPIKANQIKFATWISQLQHLTRLTFTDQGSAVDHDVLSAIADGCPALEHVDLHYCTFGDKDIRYFLEKKKDRLLSVSISYKSTATYISLTQCVKLQCLSLENYNSGLPSPYVELLANLSLLKELSLYYFQQIQTINLHKIFANKALPHLVKLEIHYCAGFNAQILDRILKNCPDLQYLKISDTSLKDGFEVIGSCSKLEVLSIECYELKDRNLEYMGAGCHNLKDLDLSYCQQLTDRAIEYICSGCTKLERLILNELPELTDEVFQSIFKCKSLRFLSMAWHPNMAGDYLHMVPVHLINLTEFRIRSCGALCRQQVIKLKEEMPQLKFYLDEVIPYDEDDDEIFSDIELETAEFFIAQLL